MSNYKEGPRDLNPGGEMRLLKYNPNTGLKEIVDLIRNPSKVVPLPPPTGFFGKLFAWCRLPNFNYEIESEVEWLKLAIEKAKSLGCSQVEYYDYMPMIDSYRREIVWDQNWK